MTSKTIRENTSTPRELCTRLAAQTLNAGSHCVEADLFVETLHRHFQMALLHCERGRDKLSELMRITAMGEGHDSLNTLGGYGMPRGVTPCHVFPKLNPCQQMQI